MSPGHDTTATLPRMREGTAHLLGVVDKVGDEAFAEPSALPGWTCGHVIGHVARTAEVLDRSLAALTPGQWRAQVRSAPGRAIPAAEVPWMRIREMWLHAVDLGAGATLDDLPDGVVDLLLDDVTAALSIKEGCPAVELVEANRVPVGLAAYVYSGSRTAQPGSSTGSGRGPIRGRRDAGSGCRGRRGEPRPDRC